jgi:geranylgeranyl pyrophosphate synthase
VALRAGAAQAGAPPGVHDILSRYSDALGVAYQIRDDVEDLDANDAPDDVRAMRPSLPLAMAWERAKGAARDRFEHAWIGGVAEDQAADVRREITESGVAGECGRLVEMYKQQAIETLPDLGNASLKGLLRRVVGKIFRVEIRGWCSEFEARNAAGGAARSRGAG